MCAILQLVSAPLCPYKPPSSGKDLNFVVRIEIDVTHSNYDCDCDYDYYL